MANDREARRPASVVMLVLLVLGVLVLVVSGFLADKNKQEQPNQIAEANWQELNRAAQDAQEEGNYAEAAKQWNKALAVAKTSDSSDGRVEQTLKDLADLYEYDLNDPAHAEPVYRQLLSIYQQTFGENDPDVARVDLDLANVMCSQKKWPAAEQFVRRSLKIGESSYNNADITRDLNLLGDILFEEGRLKDAEPCYKQALRLGERSCPDSLIEVADSSQSLALLYAHLDRKALSRQFAEKALKTRMIYERF
ncbi:MAG: hypothetical protein C5B53_06655 [Candidatus Melainabacteria bacterium]|nr:MAG: hypothetical protein C5B53_06655 [Candidatus Melainabacteria bacterium]